MGYGCMTCIGNSGPLAEPIVEAIEKVSINWDEPHLCVYVRIICKYVSIVCVVCISDAPIDASIVIQYQP